MKYQSFIIQLFLSIAVFAEDFEREIPILFQCTANERVIEGTIKLEEDLEKWTLQNTDLTKGLYYYEAKFELSSLKKIQILLNNVTYENVKPTFRMKVESRSTISNRPTLSDLDNKTFHRYYDDYATLSLTNSKTGFEIKLSSKNIQNLNEGFIQFMHYGVLAKCPYRFNPETESQLDSESLPSLLSKP